MLSCFDEEEFVYGETYAAARTSAVEISVRFAQRVEECQTRRHQVRYAKHQIKTRSVRNCVAKKNLN